MNYELFGFNKISYGNSNLGSSYSPNEQMAARIVNFYKRNGIESTKPLEKTLAEKYLTQDLVATYPINWTRDSSYDTDDSFGLTAQLNLLAGTVNSLTAQITSIIATSNSTDQTPPTNPTNPAILQGTDVGDVIVLVKNAYSSYNMIVEITAKKPNAITIIGTGVYSAHQYD